MPKKLPQHIWERERERERGKISWSAILSATSPTIRRAKGDTTQPKQAAKREHYHGRSWRSIPFPSSPLPCTLVGQASSCSSAGGTHCRELPAPLQSPKPRGSKKMYFVARNKPIPIAHGRTIDPLDIATSRWCQKRLYFVLLWSFVRMQARVLLSCAPFRDFGGLASSFPRDPWCRVSSLEPCRTCAPSPPSSAGKGLVERRVAGKESIQVSKMKSPSHSNYHILFDVSMVDGCFFFFLFFFPTLPGSIRPMVAARRDPLLSERLPTLTAPCNLSYCCSRQ